jgi:uncharacterized protein YbbC (DUF1343 family)
MALPATAAVLPGIDVLAGRNFDILKGKRVGLITNQTGRSSSGASSIDILLHAPGVRLVALYSPEHGIRGGFDEKIGSGVDHITGLPVHSLYGATCSPTPEMLKGVDVLVFDIQDIGTRFYTYIGTLSLAMRAAREHGIPFVVLDRPNPIGGAAVSGAIPEEPSDKPQQPHHSQKGGTADPGCGELTSIHPIPTRHGMTVGELARLFNTEFGINCYLTVIPVQGWQRSMYYDETGLAWVNPSPNMKSLSAAVLYPGLGILECTNLSVARGTGRPFQMFGAPWVDGAAVAARLAGEEIPGMTFSPCEFIPTGGHPYHGQNCSGICIEVVDPKLADPVLAGLQLVKAFHGAYPDRFKEDRGFAIEVGDSRTWGLLTEQGKTPEEVVESWQEEDERFRIMREKYLLY